MKDLLNVWEERVRAGDVSAMLYFGGCFRHGLFVQKNKESAHRYYQMAADAGSAEGAYFAGLDYWFGIGTKRSRRKALRYLLASAAVGSADAMYLLGFLYQTKRLKAFSPAKQAVFFYKRAAVHNNIAAIHALGRYYMQAWAQGKENAVKKGLFWFVCACEINGTKNDLKCVKSLHVLQFCAVQRGYSMHSLTKTADKILQAHSGVMHSDRSRLFVYIIALKDLLKGKPPL